MLHYYYWFMSRFFKNLYLDFFHWIISRDDLYSHVKSLRIHLFLVVVFLTGLLMWSYAFLAYMHIDHSGIRYAGFLYSFLHLMAPLAYRLTKSLNIGVYFMLIPGGLFQLHFSCLTGGMFSPTIIWVGILPLIAGILTNKRHTLLWAFLVILSVMIVFVADTLFGPLPNYFSDKGKVIAQFLVVFGMILLNSYFTLFILQVAKRSVDEISKKALSKQNLLRIIAHDITGPLSIINSAAFSVKRANNLENVTKKANMIEKCIKSITGSIESIRNIEAYESGKKDLILVPVDLVKCVENAEFNLQYLIASKKVHISKKIPDHLKVLGIESIVENQIIGNLLSNAIKYSEVGGLIEIEASAYNKDVELKVRDYGIGIPSYILKNLFDPFLKTNRPGTAGEDGTGFGMAIVKNAIDLLNGKIVVESSTGLDTNTPGSTFIIHLQKVEK